MSPERPKGNIITKAAKIGVPVALLVSQAACATWTPYDINIPPCDTDPQSKTETVTLSNDSQRGNRIKIDEIIIKARGRGPSVEVDIDQRKQPEGHRLEIFPDGHMEFRGINGRIYSISKQSVSGDPNGTKLTIKADCETTPKTNP